MPGKNKGILLGTVHFITFFIMPVLIILLVLSVIFTNSEYYTRILKNADLINGFIEVKNIETNNAIQEEIEREVGLKEYTAKFEKISENYQYRKEEYKKINKEEEYRSLVEQKKDLKSMTWEEAKEIFPAREQFEKNREGELARVTSMIKNIETYRDEKEDMIEEYEDRLEDAEDEYNDAKDILEDKQDDARDIADKHKNTFSNRLYADLEILNPVLTKILNEKLIEGSVRNEIEKLLNFFTSYEKQKAYGNIYSISRPSNTLGEKQMLRVRFPEITISMWIKEDVNGEIRSRHLLSDIFVDEIRKMNNLQNRGLFITMFKFADTGLGEFVGRRFLKKTGIKISNGLIYMDNLVLEDESAETVATVMKVSTWSQYLIYAVPGILILYLLILFFSSAERRKKLKGLQVILIYPSLIIIIASGFAIVASRFVLDHYPQLITDVTLQTYAKSLLFVVSLHTFIPVAAVFTVLLITGLVLKKINNSK